MTNFDAFGVEDLGYEELENIDGGCDWVCGAAKAAGTFARSVIEYLKDAPGPLPRHEVY